MNMKKKRRTMMLLVLFLLCLHVHASSNPNKTIHSVDTRDEHELVVHKSGVINNPVVRRGGGGGGHGGGGGGHGGGHGGGSNGGGGGDAGAVIPVYAGSHRTPRSSHGRNNGEHNSTGVPQLVSTILALVLLLSYCC